MSKFTTNVGRISGIDALTKALEMAAAGSVSDRRITVAAKMVVEGSQGAVPPWPRPRDVVDILEELCSQVRTLFAARVRGPGLWVARLGENITHFGNISQNYDRYHGSPTHSAAR